MEISNPKSRDFSKINIKPENTHIPNGEAKDPVKDQTDFLAQLSYEQLSHTLFPIGRALSVILIPILSLVAAFCVFLTTDDIRERKWKQ